MKNRKPKKEQKEILELKSASEMKNSLEEFKGRYEQADESITMFEDRKIEIIRSEGQKEKELKKSDQHPGDLWTLSGRPVCPRELQKRRERREQREYVKK